MPAHDEALNDRSLIPPVSVTMQPRVLVPVPAVAVLVAVLVAGLLLVGLDAAELWLLPHAATTSVADTASAAAAHALILTLTSTGPGTSSAWPHIRPGLSRRLCLVVPAWEEDTRRSGLLVAESEPDHDDIPGLPDIQPPFRPGILVLSYRLTTSCRTAALLAGALLAAALLLGTGTPGKSSVTVRPPPGVS